MGRGVRGRGMPGSRELQPELVEVRARINPRQERFCQSLMRGSSVRGAYLEAYGDLSQTQNPDHQSQHASRILSSKAVQARLQDLMAAADVTAEWVVRHAKKLVEEGDSETARVQALGLLARRFPAEFAGGGAGGVSTRVNVIAGSGASVNVTNLGAGLDSAEARAIAETALRSLLAPAPAPEPVVVEVEVVDTGEGVTP